MEPTLSKREVRRSFVLNVANGAFFDLAERLIDPPLVLTWFVSQLTTSNLLIGLVAPLGDAGWFLPQIFVSAQVQRMPRKMPSYNATAAVRAGAWVLLALAVWLVNDPALLLVAFFTLYSIARLASGLAGLAFFDITAKTIPARQRGSLFTWRQFAGGVLGLGAGWVVRTVLNHPALPFPDGHAVLFGLYCLAVVPGLAVFMAIREPAGAVKSTRVTISRQLRRGGELLRENLVFRRYMLARLLGGLGAIALPFYGIYARNVLGAPEGMVGTYIAARVAAQLLFNLPWGWLSDRRGNQLVNCLLHLGNGVTVLLALLLVGAVELLGLRGAWLPYLALPLFFLDGIFRPAQILAGGSYLMELVEEDERPLYLGVSNTLMGVVTLLSGAGGLAVDLFGFAGLFVLALGLYGTAYGLARGLPEPREENKTNTQE